MLRISVALLVSWVIGIISGAGAWIHFLFAAGVIVLVIALVIGRKTM